MPELALYKNCIIIIIMSWHGKVDDELKYTWKRTLELLLVSVQGLLGRNGIPGNNGAPGPPGNVFVIPVSTSQPSHHVHVAC